MEQYIKKRKTGFVWSKESNETNNRKQEQYKLNRKF